MQSVIGLGMNEPQPYQIVELDTRSPHLSNIAAWLNAEWGAAQGYSLDQTLAWCRDTAGDDDQCLLAALADEQLLGAVLVVHCDLPSHAHLRPWVSGLYVDKAQRGRGIGADLAQAASDWTRQRQHPALYLFAPEGRLVAFYHRLGWRPLDGFSRNGIPYRVMQRQLLPSRHTPR